MRLQTLLTPGPALVWTLALPLCTVAWWTHAQLHIIGSPEPIRATQGDDVVLPCHLEPQLNIELLTVEWSKPDLKPDPSDRLNRVAYVHLYRNRREDQDMKLQRYASRTTLLRDDLRRGDASLRIRNVTLEDEGPYMCFIPKLESERREVVILLSVAPRSHETQTTDATLDRDFNVSTSNPESSNETIVPAGSRHHWFLFASVSFWVLVFVGGGFAGLLLKHKFAKRSVRKMGECIATAA